MCIRDRFKEAGATGGIELLQTRADLLAAEKKWPEARKEIDEILKLSLIHIDVYKRQRE